MAIASKFYLINKKKKYKNTVGIHRVINKKKKKENEELFGNAVITIEI